MIVFRSMLEATDGLPKIGPSARLLGVRTGHAPTPDVLAVNPDDLVSSGQGEMSVAPQTPMSLPRHRRPASLGGIGRDPVWYIDTDDLGADLQFRPDSATHGVIEPAHVMTLREYQDALGRTRDRWLRWPG